MEELDPALVAKRSVRGVFAFISRSFFVQIVNFVRDFLLAILLAPSAYGVYYVVESFIAIVAYFSDVGLAGALIQKKETLTQEDLRTTFTIQQTIMLVLVGIVLGTSSLISNFLHFPPQGLYLLQAFVIAFFLSSLKTIPSVILERNLEFGKFVIPQIVETLFYSVTVVVLAFKGFGIASFTYAVLARGISGLIAMYIICPWKIGFGFSKKSLSHLLFFGVPFQLNSILALIKDNLLILFLSRLLPFTQVGYIAFAQKWAFTPLRLVMDNIIRVTFASFSRLQHDKAALGKAFEKSLAAGTSLIFPALMGLVIIVPYAMDLIPKYHKWEPAYISLIYFCINAALAAVLVPLTNLLNAIGRIKITLYFMIFWTCLTWALTFPALHVLGYSGFPLVTAIVNVSVILVIFMAKKYVTFSTIKPIQKPFIATVIMGAVLFSISSYVVTNLITLILLIAIGAVVYISSLFAIGREEFMTDIRFIKGNLKK